MFLSDQVPICYLKCGLKPFQALVVYCIFVVEVNILSGANLADDMSLEKVRYLLLDTQLC